MLLLLILLLLFCCRFFFCYRCCRRCRARCCFLMLLLLLLFFFFFFFFFFIFFFFFFFFSFFLALYSDESLHGFRILHKHYMNETSIELGYTHTPSISLDLWRRGSLVSGEKKLASQARAGASWVASRSACVASPQ